MNRLTREKSPYLLQHAENPVDWYAWGEEAFAKARAENKPVFLSIGYSTCHWCHVMAHESFEDEATAAIMNREFVNIKVDREERPDVDRVYMTFVQATTGHGGWPMSVWLTSELKPFVGGTYFPPEDRYGHPGFKKVLERIARAWRENREQIVEQGDKIIAALAESAASAGSGELTGNAVDEAYEQFARSYDAHEGGFGSAPKFPRPSVLNFLARFYARERQSRRGAHALDMSLFTLRKMAAGGIHDHLGGGFARYSVDSFWHVPHFEKMLYDQAQLAIAYTEAFQITREPFFEQIARDVLDYVQRDMTCAEGAFFSAEDADSLFEHGKPEHGEGAFYVWTQAQIDEALGEDAPIFCSRYGVEANGNVRPESDPHGEFTGKNVLFQSAAIVDTAHRFRLSEEATHDVLERCRRQLFELREQRPRPHLDDKIITAWNGLMISAFARAAQVFDAANYAAAARRAAEFLRSHLFDQSTRELRRSYREGANAVRGFAEDYAFFIQALLDLYETDFDLGWISLAEELQSTQDRFFWDQRGGGYFSASANDPSILLRMKDENDGAEPAASSIAAMNLLRLAQFTDASRFGERAKKTMNAFAPQISRFASVMPQMLVALSRAEAAPQQILLAGKREEDDTRALLREVRRHFLPYASVILADENGGAFFGSRNAAIASMKSVGGQAAAYVCKHFTCGAPVTDASALGELLS